MHDNRIIDTDYPVRDLSEKLIGRLVHIGVDNASDEFTFAVLKADAVRNGTDLVIIPGRALHARRINDPDEFILSLTLAELPQAPCQFGFRWPDLVCHEWIDELAAHLADGSKSPLANEGHSDAEQNSACPC